MITKLVLKDFTGFHEVEIDFSPKVNVIIGENGTGKTHLLKAAYSLCFQSSQSEGKPSSRNDQAGAITSKLLRLFMPLDEKLGRIRRHGAADAAKLEARFALDKTIIISFQSNSKSVVIEQVPPERQYESEPIFIPTKEVLSFISAIANKTSDQGTVRALFDDTYLDLCKSLLKRARAVSSERLDLDPRFGTVFPALVNSIHGRYEFYQGEFRFRSGIYETKRTTSRQKYAAKTETIFKPTTDEDVSNNMTAEGFRKIGVLQQLLANKALNPGTSGPLFWDEPESNMNPKLTGLLVRMLIELSRNGQQIILATHDYVLLKWFDLLVDKGKDDHVRFHVLYRAPESKEIKIDSTDSYHEINPNSIADSFSDLTDHEITKSMGDLGK